MYIVHALCRLDYTNAGSCEYVNVLEELNLHLQASHQDLAYSSSSVIDPTQIGTAASEEELDSVENQPTVDEERNEESGFDCQNVAKQNTSERRSTHFSNQSTSRSRVKSESGIGQRMHHYNNGGYEEAGRQFSREQSTRRSTHSEAGLQVNRQNRAKARVTIEDSNLFENPKVHSQQDESTIPVSGLQVNTISLFGDIPAFIDPEWIRDGNQDNMVTVEMLGHALPPDIYSSQVLTTGASFQGVSENVEISHAHSDSNLSMSSVCIITETNRSTGSLDRIISIQPHTCGKLHTMTYRYVLYW